jgi:cytochrome c biogenesis factor
MSKSGKSKKSHRASTDRAATVDVVSQLECAIRYPQATLIGALVGGVVPWFARTLAHVEVPAAWSAGHHTLAMLMLVVVLGCACFSALTVYKFGRATFNDTRKALGFVLAIEGVMLVSQGITSSVALAVLIAINALANGSAIAMAREVTCKRRQAAVRANATRARGRVSTKSPIVIDQASVPAPASHAARPSRSSRRAVVVPHQWNGAMDVVDAEIVSEQKFLS